MSNQIALITGSSRGIGLEMAIKLGQRGYRVYASMRDTSKDQDIQTRARDTGLVIGQDILIVPLDVDDVTSIKSAVNAIYDKEGRIDVAVNNAGLFMAGVLECLHPEDIKHSFRTNVLGTIFVTQTVLPLMKAQRSGFIMNVSAVGGVNGSAFSDIFCSTKFAVEGFTESIAQVALQFDIKVCLVELGPTTHPHVQHLQVHKEGADPHTLQLLDRFNASCPEGSTVQTAEEVAEIMADTIQNEDPPFRLQTHRGYYQTDIEDKLKDPSGWGKIREMSQRCFGQPHICPSR